MYSICRENKHTVLFCYTLHLLLSSMAASHAHYSVVIMGAMAFHIASLTIVYSTVYTGADQRKHQSSASLTFVWGIPTQMASTAENVSIWWRLHEMGQSDHWGHDKTAKRNPCTVFGMLCITAKTSIHWNENVVILKKFAPLTALKVVKMATVSAAIDENLIKSNKISVFGFKRMLFIYEKGRLFFVRTCTGTLHHGQNGRHFADDIFKRIFMNEKSYIFIRISPKFVPEDPIDNKSALVQEMAWRRTGDKPLSEPMLTRFTCGTRGRWINVTIC